MPDTTYIYGLLDPELVRIRYVGASTTPIRRYNAHCAPSQVNQALTGRGVVSAKQGWIGDLHQRGYKPELVILEQLSVSHLGMGNPHPDARAAEERWMLYLMDHGHPLTNGRLPSREGSQDEIQLREAVERGRELFPE